jgi:hypothetical protein
MLNLRKKCRCVKAKFIQTECDLRPTQVCTYAIHANHRHQSCLLNPLNYHYSLKIKLFVHIDNEWRSFSHYFRECYVIIVIVLSVVRQFTASDYLPLVSSNYSVLFTFATICHVLASFIFFNLHSF